MLEVKNLTKFYGNFLAVNDISFNVPDNEIVGFLGPNGAGKSTTMNVITGALSPSKGCVKVNNFDISEDPKNAKRQIGYLPEFPPLYSEMKVIEYLKFVAGIKEVPRLKVKAQIDYVCEKLKIEDRRNQVIRSLSKGYKQRVGFAGALLGLPKVLVLDEPTVGLDPNQIIEVRNLIKELKKDHTIILSTHIMQEVQATCDRVIIIAEGEVRADNTLPELGKLISKNIIISLAVEGQRSKIHDVIKNSKGFIKFNDIEQLGHESYSFVFEVENSATQKEIVKKLINQDFNVTGARVTEPDLEDVFVQLSKPKPRKTSADRLRSMIESQE